jgi:hypothetical protein
MSAVASIAPPAVAALPDIDAMLSAQTLWRAGRAPIQTTMPGRTGVSIRRASEEAGLNGMATRVGPSRAGPRAA